MGQILHGSAKTTEAVRRALLSEYLLLRLPCQQDRELGRITKVSLWCVRYLFPPINGTPWLVGPG